MFEIPDKTEPDPGALGEFDLGPRLRPVLQQVGGFLEDAVDVVSLLLLGSGLRGGRRGRPEGVPEDDGVGGGSRGHDDRLRLRRRRFPSGQETGEKRAEKDQDGKDGEDGEDERPPSRSGQGVLQFGGGPEALRGVFL